jgi:putative Mn2+ efflux pump MntP
MDLLTPALIGICLSMDCFAVALMIGATTKIRPIYAAVIIALCFGAFQTGLTIIGCFAGIKIMNLIAGYGNVIAFILLVFIGMKMILDGLSRKEECIEIIQPVSVITLSIATSVDAFPAGLTLGILQFQVLIPALIIGVVAFTLSFTGVMAGKRFERIFGNKSDIAGGIILILMGIWILTGILPG